MMNIWYVLFLLSLTRQLTASSTPRAAFMHCLRWGVWCPLQEPSDWNGEQIQLRLRGDAKPNPFGVMVYSTQTSAKTQTSPAASAAEAAQVIRPHTKSVCSRSECKRMPLKVLISAPFSSNVDVSFRSFLLSKLFPWHVRLKGRW